MENESMSISRTSGNRYDKIDRYEDVEPHIFLDAQDIVLCNNKVSKEIEEQDISVILKEEIEKRV